MNGQRRDVMNPFFTYLGGKWRIAPHYPPPELPLIIEPFAGSAGYSMRYPDNDVLLIDVDPYIVETWAYLISGSPKDVRDLPLTWNGSVRDLDIPLGAQYLIGWWLNKGTASPCLTPSAWMRSGVRPHSFWGREIRERIATQMFRIHHWEIKRASYADLPAVRATWFVDPPYEVAGQHYRNSHVDYGALARWVRERPGQVMVCENEGARWLPFAPLIDAKATPGKSRAGISREVLWRSGA